MAENGRLWLMVMRLVLLGVVLPNLLFDAVALWLNLGRPYLNFDYVLIGVLLCSRWRMLGYVLLVPAVLIDALMLLGQIFPFARMQDLFYLLGVANLASLYYQGLGVLASVLVILVMGLYVYAWRRDGQLKIALVILNLSLLGYLYSVYGNDSAATHNRFWRVVDRPLVSSQIADFAEYRSRSFIQSAWDDAEPFAPSPYPTVNTWLGSEQVPERALLIVVESWGQAANPLIQQAIMAPLKNAKTVQQFESGSSTFFGATIAGELRELCQLQPNHFNMAIVKQGLEDCLPNRLQALGYETAAMHGATGMMYDRAHWYPLAGFQQTVFFESRAWPRRCYSFPGACDWDMRDVVADYFKVPGKRFMYWLTLNSHSFYDLRDLHYDRFDCRDFDIEESTESCRNLKLQAQFFSGLARLVERPEMAGVQVVVVGDHTPAIFDVAELSRNFLENKVAWLKFSIK